MNALVKIREINIKNTAGILVAKKYLENRQSDVYGRLKGWVSGHGGDVWWISHEDGTLAPYFEFEFDVASIQGFDALARIGKAFSYIMDAPENADLVRFSLLELD